MRPNRLSVVAYLILAWMLYASVTEGTSFRFWNYAIPVTALLASLGNFYAARFASPRRRGFRLFVGVYALFWSFALGYLVYFDADPLQWIKTLIPLYGISFLTVWLLPSVMDVADYSTAVRIALADRVRALEAVKENDVS